MLCPTPTFCLPVRPSPPDRPALPPNNRRLLLPIRWTTSSYRSQISHRAFVWKGPPFRPSSLLVSCFPLVPVPPLLSRSFLRLRTSQFHRIQDYPPSKASLPRFFQLQDQPSRNNWLLISRRRLKIFSFASTCSYQWFDKPHLALVLTKVIISVLPLPLFFPSFSA